MATVVLGDPPPELKALQERRRKAGVDLCDEVWEGVLHMVPAPGFPHARLTQQLGTLIGPLAQAAGLVCAMSIFNLGESKDDYRVPDGGVVRPGAYGVWVPTAAIVVEILSPDDESWDKLPFYAAQGVDELLFLHPDTSTVTWMALTEGEYRPVERSAVIALGPEALAARLDWPPPLSPE